MESFKEFEGRSLDEAISEACSYFDTAREKLEIEILQDSKSGIFGLVGARKAKVRARRVQLRNAVENILNRKGGDDTFEETPKAESSAAPEPTGHKGRPQAAPRKAAAEQPRAASQEEIAVDSEQSVAAASSPAPAPRAPRQRPKAAPKPPREDKAPAADERRRADAHTRPARPPKAAKPHHPVADGFGDDAQEDHDDLQRIPFEELDQQKLCALSLEVVGHLVRPIVGELPLSVELCDSRVNVRMDCGEDSGLLIGREGQTLASLQYLASRMVSRGMSAAVRVQLDAGEYRARQDEKLREMALGLADKVRATGKSLSTRPLSSYHRRIVHLALQDAEDVQTRSSGDGTLKRVVIQRRKG